MTRLAALKPIFSEVQPDGSVLFGLTDEDLAKVQAGYACPNCLEDFRGKWLAKCPLCKHEFDVSRDIVDAPAYWLPDPSDI